MTHSIRPTWRVPSSSRASWPVGLLFVVLVALLGLGSTLQAVAPVTASWNPNPESDIAGYKLSYGTQSGNYTTTVDVGNVTTWTISTLSPGIRYYFVVRAYNTAGLLSPASAEVFFDTPGTVGGPTLTSLSPTSGAVGNSVTLSGSNFGTTQGTSTVKFNGTVASPTSWSATSVVVPVPSGATTGNVVATVGGVDSNGLPFTVTAASAPSITSLSPNSGPVGASVTIAGANFGATQGTSAVQFNGTPGTPTTWSASSIVVTVPNGATSGNVVVTVNSAASNAAPFTVSSATLPAPWQTQDVGSPAVAGQASVASGVFSVSGAGLDIWGASDQFRFVYQTLSGDGQILARVDSLQNVDPWSKAGVMIRADLTAGAANAIVGVSAANGLTFQTRTSQAAASTSQTTPGAAPRWVRLVRSGNTLTAYYSSDGAAWTLLNSSSSVALPTQVYVGLAVTSHNGSIAAAAAFSNVAVGAAAVVPTVTSLSPNSGVVGSSVTIAGSNFGATQGTSTVKFNGTSATPTSWSASSIVTPVPTGATTGSVVVTVGGLPTTGLPFTVLIPPTITTQPQSQSIAWARTATLTVAATGTMPLSYQWYQGASGTTTTPIAGATGSSYTTPVLLASTSYWVRVTNTTATADSATATITVGAAPTNLLVQDLFTGAAGTALTAHAPDVNVTGNPWSLNGGTPTPTLSAGGVGITAGPGHLQATINSGVSDVTMGVDYRAGSGPGMGALVVRLTDPNNFFVVETYLNTLYIYKRQAGAWIVLGSQALPSALAPGSTHRLEVRTLAATLEGWWDGARLLQVSDSFQQTATRHGLDWNTAYDTTSTYANFQLALNGSASLGPTITTQPQSQSVVSGQSATLSVAANGVGTLSYQWYQGASGTTTSPISGATASSFTTPALTASANYWVRVSNTSGTADSTTAAITIVVVPTGVLVQDTFAGTAGTALTSHLPDVNLTGNPWSLNGGTPTPTLVGGAVGITAGPGHLQATINSGVSDVTVGVDYRAGAGPGMGAVVVRLTDANNFFVFETYLNTLYLYKRQGGTWIALGSQPLPATLMSGSTHRLEARTLGSTLEGWWDGLRLLQVTDSFQQTATRHGIDWNAAYDTTATYANFQLALNGTAPPASPTITSLSVSSGPVGTPVTITGTNFGAAQGTSTVKFNGTTATPTSWSASSIAVSVPSGATTGNVVVTVGGTSSNGSLFTIPAPPVITAQPQSQTIASGQSATLSVAATGGTLSYQWYQGTSGTTTSPISGATASSYTTPSLTASTNYWVRVTNATGPTNSATAAITVSAVPPGVLVQDTFAGSAGTTLTAHLPDVNLTGNAWSIFGGPPTPTLTAGGVGVTAGAGHLQAAINSGAADVVMGVDYRVGSGPGMGALAVRLTDANNFFVFETYLNTLYLYKRQAGTWIALGSQPLPSMLVPGSTHRLEVHTLGATLEGWWDGALLLQASDSFQQTATRHGLDWNAAYDTTTTYANFQLSLNGVTSGSPSITSQPQSQTVVSGQSATLSVGATGATGYQWYQGVSGTTTTPITGATASSYTTPALTASTSYWVRASNGSGTTDSATAAITVSAVQAGMLVQDTFIGTAGTALTAHQPDVNLTGNPWSLFGGPPTPTLSANTVGVTAGAGHLQATINSGVSDVTMGVDYRVGGGPGMGALVVRLTDANNFFVFETYLNTLYVYKRQGGTWIALGGQPLPSMLVAGTTHRLEVRTLGSTLEGWWDGVRLIQVTDSFQQTATRHGLDWNTAYDTTTTYANFSLSLPQ